ncbi:MAG: hypothetical protein AABX64_01085 [Nanoarchaeota archaeon]
MTLETITGNLRDAYRQLQPGTMLHADELINERRDNSEELCDQSFYTADGEVYFLKGKNKTPTLAMTREAHNPVLQNIDAAFEQLIKHEHNYLVPQADFKQALAAPDTTLIALPELRLSAGNQEYGYLPIGTAPAKYKKLNAEERTFAERVFGQGNDFVQNMAMLKSADISETKIFVLNPKYVQEHASQGAVARASWLYYFVNSSNFGANDRFIDIRLRVRGVRLEAPAGRGAQNGDPYRIAASNSFAICYDTILSDPESAVKVLNDERAAGLAKLLGSYLSAKGK